jgi:hypothetical protein
MMKGLNPPLHTDQILKSRDTSQPDYKIVDFMPSHKGMEWFIEPVGGGERRRLSLSEIYAEFQFAD